jgi:glycerol-3-phosphate dehydrogenase
MNIEGFRYTRAGRRRSKPRELSGRCEKMNTWQASDRLGILEEMTKGHLDLLVIGGGITGAGVAWDASLRGLNVGLVEKQDFAAGTSSRSTKLIHGGLRYLKQLDFGLVREVGRERAVLHRLAPHLVRPEPMLLPIVKGGQHNRFATSWGLWLYDRLAGVSKRERRTMLTRDEVLRLEPLLRKEDLLGGGLYVEYRTDDARLTLAVLKSAVACGALAVNYAEVTQFLHENRKLAGAVVTDCLSRRTFTVTAKKIVNAAGPWADRLRAMDGSLSGKRLHHTKGVHIVVARRRLPIGRAIYFDVPDGRMVFAIPKENKVYVGTTDTDYEGPLEEPGVTKADCDYLLEAVNQMFPEVRLASRDVISHWSGIRPLIHEAGKGPSELSRKDEIFHSETGLMTIAGGKLTGFRKMAERVVDQVCMAIHMETGRIFKHCQTDRVPIDGGEPDDQKNTAPPSMGDLPVDIAAKLEYGLLYEMVVHPLDFLVRRTAALYFEREKYHPWVETIVNVMARRLHWPDPIRAAYLAETLKTWRK